MSSPDEPFIFNSKPPSGGGGAVDSVNSKTGVVVLTADDIASGIINHYLTFPIVVPNSAEGSPNIKSDSDTGLSFPSDGEVSMENNNVVTQRWHPNSVDFLVGTNHTNINATGLTTTDFLAVNTDATVTGNLTVNTVNGVAYPPPIPTGAFNTFAGYDGAGNLGSLSGWGINTATLGANVNQSYDLSLSGQDIQRFFSDFNPTASTANGGAGFNLITRYDPLGLNFDSDRVDGLAISNEHDGNGHVNTLRTFSVNNLLGNGITTGSVDFLSGVEVYATIQAGATATNTSGITYNLNNLGTITQDTQLLRVTSNGNAIGRNVGGLDILIQNDVGGTGNENLISITSSGTKANASVGIFGNFQQNANFFEGIHFGKSGTTTTNENGFSWGGNGTVGGNAYMFAGGRTNTATVAGYSYGLSVLDQSDSGGFIGASIFKSGNTTDAGSYMRGLEINLQGNSAQDIYGASIDITGTAAGNVQGFKIDVANASSPNIKTGLLVNGGTLLANYQISTADVTPTPFGNVHGIGGSLTIAAGHPLLATPLFLNNFGFQIGFEDDATADNSLGAGNSIGQSILAFVNQVAGAAGKTFDTLNYAFLGGSNSDPNTGHINEVNIYRGAGLINAGGGLTVGTSRVFYVDPVFDGALGANKWGFINASSSNNWMKGSLVLGGVTGALTGAFVLDVTGDASISGAASLGNGSTTTTQTAGDNSAKIATTEYVDGPQVVAAKTANYTLVADDKYILGDTATSIDLQLPPSVQGRVFNIKNINSGTTNVLPDGAELIDGQASLALDTLNRSVSLVGFGGGWYIF